MVGHVGGAWKGRLMCFMRALRLRLRINLIKRRMKAFYAASLTLKGSYIDVGFARVDTFVIWLDYCDALKMSLCRYLNDSIHLKVKHSPVLLDSVDAVYVLTKH